MNKRTWSHPYWGKKGGVVSEWQETIGYKFFIPKDLLLFAIDFVLKDILGNYNYHGGNYFTKHELRFSFYQHTGYLLDIKQIEGALNWLVTNQFLVTSKGFRIGYFPKMLIKDFNDKNFHSYNMPERYRNQLMIGEMYEKDEFEKMIKKQQILLEKKVKNIPQIRPIIQLTHKED